MTIRNASINDLESISRIENLCFPENEAASLNSLTKRLKIFPHHFWILEENATIVGFINGMVTDNDTIVDEMFADAELHNDNGTWQCIFGLAVLPEYRKFGYASKLINHFIETARQQNRKGVTLTCKEYLISYYGKRGFYNAGLSGSVHGGEVWYDMKVDLTANLNLSAVR